MKKLLSVILITVFFLLLTWILCYFLLPKQSVVQTPDIPIPEWIDPQIIDVDGTSRRGMALEDVKDIVIHYTANPGSTAQGNHDYFASASSEVSSHFIVGLDGEIIQCIPLNERSSASNWRNKDTISIEVCHPDETGEFSEATYKSLVTLTAWLINTYDLSIEHVIRHYDITGKMCPLYYVENESAWTWLKEDIQNAS